MTERVIGCTVYIDGEPISDGCSALSPDAPAVLSGLRVIWGRTTSVDQSAASSCTFEIDDPLTGDRIVPALTIGRQIDVQADTVIYPDPTESTIPVLLPGPVSNVQQVSGTGTTSNMILAGPDYRAAVLTYPPRDYSQNPLAWDDVPRTLPGQAWELRVQLAMPGPFAGWLGYAARVQPVTFASPAGPGTLLPDNATLSPGSTSATLRFTPPAGVWLGLQIAIHPAGPRWTDLDSTPWINLPNPGPSWDDLARFVLSGVQMLAPAAGAADSGLVFSGRITDVAVEWDGGDSTTISVIAQDWLAELANRFVGDTPWAMEPIAVRAQRIVQQSGQPVTLKVDPGLGALRVTYRDVDRQPAASLLQQLATSGGGILWTASHLVTGQTMWIEDIARRPAALTLSTAGTGLVHVVPSKAAVANSMPVSACDIEADPVRFALDMSDTVSMVSLTWNEQTVNTEGQQTPTQRTIEVIDSQVMRTIGARRLSVSTQLAIATDAQAQAALWLARSSNLAWRIEGLAWDTGLLPGLDPASIDSVMTLLDGTRRIGLPIALTDLPEWSWPVAGGMPSVALYVEGGTYEYHAGAWRLELNTSSATASAAGNLPWSALPGPVVPAATRTNLVPNPRAVQAGSANWPDTRGTGATYSWLTGIGTPPAPGVITARRKTYTAASDGSGFWLDTAAGGGFPITAGRSYAISLHLRHTAGSSRNGMLQVGWFTATGVQVGTWQQSAQVAIASGTAWVRVSGVFTAPAGATNLLIAGDLAAATMAAGNTFDASAAMIEQAAAVGSYFDGSTTDAPPLDYGWSGAANASTSTARDTTTPQTGWRWIDFDPAVQWIDLYGVTYPDV